ncbi:MAG: hypothetical protein ACE5NL_01205 [Candidatus Hydrothermarchaeaceae archaeon]
MREIGNKWRKVEPVLETIGVAFGLTLVQAAILYVLLGVNPIAPKWCGFQEAELRCTVYKVFRNFFESYLGVFNAMYLFFASVMYRLFGGSYLHVQGFNNIFKLVFFVIFVVNLIYFALSKYLGKKNEDS